MNKGIRNKISFFIIFIYIFTGNTCYATGEMDLSPGKAAMRMILNIFVFIFIIILAIYGTRFIGKRTSGFINSKHMEIIDIIKLDSNTKVAIICINRMIYIMAIAGSTVKLLDRFSEDEFVSSHGQSSNYKPREHEGTHLDDEHIGSFQDRIYKLLNRFNKLTDGEENNNEEMD